MPAEATTASPTETHRRTLKLGTLLACCLAVCVAQIGLAIPATLNGLFQADLHPVGSQLTWISDAFLLPVAVLELTFGVLGDLFGRKRLLVGGAAFIALGELIASLAGGVHQLWLGQAIAGLGSAALFPTSLAMIAAGVHTHRERAKMISIWAAALSTGGFLAPLIGGITGNQGSWKAAFVAVVILAVMSAVVSLLFATNSLAPEGRSLDWGGQITIAISLFALLFAVIEGPTRGWSSSSIVTAFVIAVVFMGAFLVAESRAPAPLLRLELFRSRSFSLAAIVAVVGMFSFLGTAYATSIRLGPIQHQTPLRTSLAFVALNGLALVQTPITVRLLQRFQAGRILAIGLVLMGIGDFWAATVPVGNHSLITIGLPLLPVGVGFGLAVTALTALAVGSVPPSLTGMASGATSLLRDFGFTLGPAIVGAVALSRAAASFTTSLNASNLSPAIKGAAGAVAKAGGPLAVNSVPPQSAPGQAQALALQALGHGYTIGYVLCGVAAIVAAGLTLLAKHSNADESVDLVAAEGGRVPSQPGLPATTRV